MTSTAPGSNCPPGTARQPVHRHHRRHRRPADHHRPSHRHLGAAAPGGTITSSLGTVQVTDGRGFSADWTATVSSTDFTTGSGRPAETIPAGDATYTITGLATATGPATFSHSTPVSLSGNPQAVVSATNVNGNTAVTWNPLIQITMPGGAIGGTYTATITHSTA